MKIRIFAAVFFAIWLTLTLTETEFTCPAKANPQPPERVPIEHAYIR